MKSCDQDFPDCVRCRGPRSVAIREFWGCDGPAKYVVWMSSCSTCHGTDLECPDCYGTNRVNQYRCPSSTISEAPVHLAVHVDLLMRSHRHYSERNVLPAEGAWLDQSRSYLAAVDLIDAEKAHWDSFRIDHLEKKRQAEKAASQTPRRRR